MALEMMTLGSNIPAQEYLVLLDTVFLHKSRVCTTEPYVQKDLCSVFSNGTILSSWTHCMHTFGHTGNILKIKMYMSRYFISSLRIVAPTSYSNEAISLLQVSLGSRGVGGNCFDAHMHHISFSGWNMPERHSHATVWPFNNLGLQHKQTNS